VVFKLHLRSIYLLTPSLRILRAQLFGAIAFAVFDFVRDVWEVLLYLLQLLLILKIITRRLIPLYPRRPNNKTGRRLRRVQAFSCILLAEEFGVFVCRDAVVFLVV